jgi:hypothetical protein
MTTCKFSETQFSYHYGLFRDDGGFVFLLSSFSAPSGCVDDDDDVAGCGSKDNRRVSAENYNLMGIEHTQEAIANELKKQAASIGANGVININSEWLKL